LPFALADHSVLLFNRLVLSRYYLAMLNNRVFQFCNKVIEVCQSSVVISNGLGQLLLCGLLLLVADGESGFFAFALPFLDESSLLGLKIFFHFVFVVQLISKEFVVLLI